VKWRHPETENLFKQKASEKKLTLVRYCPRILGPVQ